jgi:CHAD domain-containing protein
MAFSWKAEKNGRSNLRRLARNQLQAAIEELNDPFSDHADAVHDARLRLKKLRSLVRLVRRAAPAAYRRENAALRDAARQLSTQRDRQAVVEAIDKLLAHAQREWGESAAHLRTLHELRQTFVASHRQETSTASANGMVEHVTGKLRAAAERLKEWTADARDERVVVTGFADSYRLARDALNAVLCEPTAEHLHEWRKQIKHHRYQVRLFQHAWPAMLEAHCEELKRLADLLGDDHDLVVLRQTITEHALVEPAAKTLDELFELLERRRRELQAEAIPLGRLLFAEKPKHLTRRFMHYWCVYRERELH